MVILIRDKLVSIDNLHVSSLLIDNRCLSKLSRSRWQAAFVAISGNLTVWVFGILIIVGTAKAGCVTNGHR